MRSSSLLLMELRAALALKFGIRLLLMQEGHTLVVNVSLGLKIMKVCQMKRPRLGSASKRRHRVSVDLAAVKMVAMVRLRTLLSFDMWAIQLRKS